MPWYVTLIICLVVAIVAIALGFLFGWNRRKKDAERAIGSAEEEALRITNEAIRGAESKKR